MWFTEPDGELLYAMLVTPTEVPFSDDAVLLWPEAWADRPLGEFLEHLEKQADKKAANQPVDTTPLDAPLSREDLFISHVLFGVYHG